MKIIRRYIGLFLVSVLSFTNIPLRYVIADSDIANFTISVNGEGYVILDGYKSPRTIKGGDNLKVNCPIGTKFKISLNAEEGGVIEGLSINKVPKDNIPKERHFTYEYSITSKNEVVDIFFMKGNEENSLTEEEVINRYNNGDKNSSDLINYRKNLVIFKGLDDFVDEDYFLKPSYMKEKSSADLMDSKVLTLVKSLSKDEVNEVIDKEAPFIKGDNKSILRIDNDLENNKGYAYAEPLFASGDLVVGNKGAVTENYNGYPHTAPFLSVGGRQAFCVMFERTDPTTGVVAYNKRLTSHNSGTNNDLIRKVLYYGYRGPGTGSISSEWSSNQNKLMIATTQAASYSNNHKTYSLGRDFANYVSGLPTPPNNFIAYIVSTGSTQDLAFWELQKKGKLQISKESARPDVTNGNNCYSLVGAEYGVYKNSNATGLVTTLTIGSSGWSNEIDLDVGTFFLKETKAPKGYSLDNTIYPVNITGGNKTTKTLKDEPHLDPVSVLLRKVDSSTGTSNPSGKGSLEGAEYTFKFYAGDYPDDVNPATLGKKPTRSWVFATDKKGVAMLSNKFKVSGDDFYLFKGVAALPYGTLTIQETKAPVGYKLNSEIHIRKISQNGKSGGAFSYNEPISKEESLNFNIKKIQSGTSIPIPNVKFKHTSPDGSFEVLKTDSQGNISIKGIHQGVHKVVEIEASSGYKLNKNEFIFEVMKDNTIKAITKTDKLAMVYNVVKGDGLLTVSNEVNPFKLKIVKVNEKGNAISGAEFTLYSDQGCKNVISRKTTNTKGELVFENIEVGKKLFLKETKAPQGYKLPKNNHVYSISTESTPIKGVFNFIVDKKKVTSLVTTGDVHIEGNISDRVASIKMVNYASKQLPVTGSRGTPCLVLFGVFLMLTTIIVNNRKKYLNN